MPNAIRRRRLRGVRFSRLIAFLVALWCGATLSGCQDKAEATKDLEQELVVFAASSLREAFSELSHEFEREHPGVTVVLHFAGSQELRTQLEQGSTADVFASADWWQIETLVREGRVENPRSFASNVPVIAVNRESAHSVVSLADLPAADCVILGTPEVPIGAYSEAILARASAAYGSTWKARLDARVCSRELNVRQILAKVALGEAQAGIVYHSDFKRADRSRVAELEIPPELNVIASYPMGTLLDARHRRLARDWVRMVHSDVGQQILIRAGFIPPNGSGVTK